jgi:hypothetical protein
MLPFAFGLIPLARARERRGMKRFQPVTGGGGTAVGSPASGKASLAGVSLTGSGCAGSSMSSRAALPSLSVMANSAGCSSPGVAFRVLKGTLSGGSVVRSPGSVSVAPCVSACTVFACTVSACTVFACTVSACTVSARIFWASALASSSAVRSSARVTKKSVRQLAQRTFRPVGPIFSSSMLYPLAQDGQTMSMANQLRSLAASCEALGFRWRDVWLTPGKESLKRQERSYAWSGLRASAFATEWVRKC